MTTAIAGSNIAFVKYWGNLDDALRLPMNGSISMTLDAAVTTTAVEFSPDFPADTLLLNGQPAAEAAVQRASKQLNHLRQLAGVPTRAHIVSSNSFPTGAGIASSASGMAALTVAGGGRIGLGFARARVEQNCAVGFRLRFPLHCRRLCGVVRRRTA